MKKLTLIIGLWAVVFGLWSVQAQQTYPQFDISGYKKWEYKDPKVDPQRNYFVGLTHLGGFYPTFTGGPWQERLQLRISGQLSQNLSVTYDLEQQPETPERYDVKVKYYNNELTFGDFTANFTGNEFASTSKFLNGVMFTAKDNWYDIITVPSAKLKSQTQKLTSQKGNNTKGPYSLGHGSIVEGSERIELNGVLLTRNVDYTIDYFEGKITFTRILTPADEFKYSYEYTNILDLFFPALSKRDFFGFQSRFTIDPEEFGKPVPKEEPVIDSAREFFPSTGTLEAEIMEEEASGRYRLKNIPVVKFSEKLTFMGTELKKNEDYIIRYEQGQIKLLTRFLPTPEEKLVVEYQYFQTSQEVESIPGIGSRGPYRLSHPNLVPESESIEVDGKLLVRDLDYAINYETGEVIFGVVIGPTSQIKALYRYNVMVIPVFPPPKFPKELKIGTTYLRESAKKSAATAIATLSESATGQSVIDNGFLLNLQNRPITTEAGATLIVKVDGRVLTQEVDYTIPLTQIDPATGNVITTPEVTLPYINDRTDPTDGYGTGSIKFINENLILPTSEVTVTYTYYKSIVGKFSGVGDGTRGPYYLRNVRNIVPGTETVQVWLQGSSVITTYTRNSSFEADAGPTGYSINYNADNPSITFNEELETTKNFQIIYQYVPPRAYEGGDISQSVYGFDGSFKIGDLFKIDTAYAKSETDQVYTAVPTTEIFNGNGKKTYDLHSPEDIIEGSEKVYINGYLRNKDIDYFISYTKRGQITFYYTTPTSQDAIQVDYEYRKPLTLGAVVTKKEDIAYRLGAETKLFGDILTIDGQTKKIGFDFTPMGGTAIGLGSLYNEYNVKLKSDFHSFFTNYSYKENNNPIGAERNRFLRSYDNSVSLGINPGGLSKINFNYRNYKSKGDPLTPNGTRSTDSLQESKTISVIPVEMKRGFFTLALKSDYNATSTEDFLRKTTTNIERFHGNAGLKFTDRLSVGFDYQQSEPKTKALRTPTAEAAEDSAHTRSIDTSYNISADLTLGPIQKLAIRTSLLNHEGQTLIKNFTSTREVLTTKNETYHLDFVPISSVNYSWDHNRQERSTVIVGGANPKTERTSANLRLTPFSWLSGGWSGTQSEAIPETGAEKKTTGKSNSYNVNWTPISFSHFKLSSNYTLSDNVQTAPSGTLEGIETKTNTDSKNVNINLIPHPIAPITLGYTIENYKSRNDHPVSASQIDTETENRTLTASITLTPIPTLSLSTNYNRKETQIIKDLKVSPEVQTKTVIDSKVTYQIFSWGTLVYARQDEKNGGEIQGGVPVPLNIEKTTQTYSLNINIPVDNPVLSSFVFIASVKSVDYKNLNNPSDDFKAALTTFEGTLNF